MSTLIFLVLAFLIYFLPTFMAIWQRCPNKWAVVALNLFLGWTVIGWVLSVVWLIRTAQGSVRLDEDNASRPGLERRRLFLLVGAAVLAVLGLSVWYSIRTTSRVSAAITIPGLEYPGAELSHAGEDDVDESDLRPGQREALYHQFKARLILMKQRGDTIRETIGVGQLIGVPGLIEPTVWIPTVENTILLIKKSGNECSALNILMYKGVDQSSGEYLILVICDQQKRAYGLRGKGDTFTVLPMSVH